MLKRLVVVCAFFSLGCRGSVTGQAVFNGPKVSVNVASHSGAGHHERERR